MKTSEIDPRYDIYYCFDNIFILYLILYGIPANDYTRAGLDLSIDARGQKIVIQGQNFKDWQKYRSILKNLSCLYKLYTLFPHDE